MDQTATPKTLRSRGQAIQAGAVRYFSGEACPRGHLADRYTLNGVCVECQRTWTKANRAAARAKRTRPA